jgi:hypothetical protein
MVQSKGWASSAADSMGQASMASMSIMHRFHLNVALPPMAGCFPFWVVIVLSCMRFSLWFQWAERLFLTSSSPFISLQQ